MENSKIHFSYPLDKSDFKLIEPYTYICESSGKGFRNALIKSFDYWLKVGDEKVQDISKVIQGLHGASLLIDDIEDNSKLRRGKPVAHSIYGIPQTINSANFVYFLIMDQCNKLGDPKATTIFIEELIRLHRGQGYDIFWRDTNTSPSEQEYMNMVNEKTGGLFRLGLRLLQAFSDNNTNYIDLVEDLGMYYQIRDDLINLVSVDYQQNKSFCEDISEGKFSFPIIHAINADSNDNRLLRILKQKTEDRSVKEHALEYIKSKGSLEYTEKKLNVLKEKIIKQINDLGGNPILMKLMESLENSSI
ncbi:hypothetical protein ACTFIW_010792 [Dictyostelium discoideum]|uniref:Geranylgeranyl pyrophosphate synthase n=1 Tax=Dictyostelium discoideum TaxID=44689 RepID=GGPPS_DICDI|nr:geranylgeranyl diphosphate synthase 1 [Dictyostelium discoideum AX4]Q54BK1.1 RecName: Full=Geranylgeranyl pyrophosphate synthase; Short=GGPP synthase; Short=GGPPSase; AltName: Full=(2E,6E)-farnesyl diphosphate synthase; AltName: Full=Dimethylallyltranstransferase; AltName: Full=Farnesyl diphosphate synthase; AltName: Full=Farnesyltranstransferase; AltName: Full=Geranylgeranyl diphosphate synthase; AltName: Full=Geranyltranstransferase [Dictyostelium discoideum]EAL60606.1 geranylgeranyl diphosp|eukprot:XP_629028.1 geranylgeranyl diphosphate synthase 1 [Dictyostelium discoideum AX4]